MKRKQRYITFYGIGRKNNHLCLEKYGLMCTRGWFECFKIGFRHIKNKKAFFFMIGKAEYKNNKHKH